MIKLTSHNGRPLYVDEYLGVSMIEEISNNMCLIRFDDDTVKQVMGSAEEVYDIISGRSHEYEFIESSIWDDERYVDNSDVPMIDLDECGIRITDPVENTQAKIDKLKLDKLKQDTEYIDSMSDLIREMNEIHRQELEKFNIDRSKDPDDVILDIARAWMEEEYQDD